jgi:hypothetical protein
LLVAAPFVVKGLMYLRVKMAMDDLVNDAAGQAKISYQGIDTELKGAASVTGIEILPAGLDQPIRIDRVHLATGDPWQFIKPDQWFRQDSPEIPAEMHIAVQSMRVPLDEAVYKTFVQRMQAQRKLGAAPPDACRSFNLDPVELKAMGFESLVMDLGMNYQFQPLDERLEMSLDINLYDIESLSMTMRLTGLVPEDLSSGRFAAVRFAQADMNVHLNPEFGRRFVAHCAKKQGVTPAAYEENLISGFRDNLQRTGITLGHELQQALENYYREWGDIRIYVKPEKPIGMGRAMSIKPDDLVRTLGISLFINDKPVNDLDVKVDLQQMAQMQGKGANAANGAKKPPAPKRLRVIREFKPTSINALDQYLGRTVRIHPQGQPVREGVLVAIVNGEAQVRQRTHGGSVTSHVPLQEIRSVEVETERREPMN